MSSLRVGLDRLAEWVDGVRDLSLSVDRAGFGRPVVKRQAATAGRYSFKRL
jgi:hypothetical protein